MRHEHLVVTVDSGTKAHIEEDLDPGETVEAWVADAIDAKLATEQVEGEKEGEKESEETGASEAIRADSDGIEASNQSEAGDEVVGRGDAETNPDDSDGTDDDYDEGFEYVDDCAI